MNNHTPSGLSPEAKRLFKALRAEYGIGDAAGVRLLQTAAEALDHMRAAEVVIKRDGLTIPDRRGSPKAHPLCAVMRDSRAAMLAALKALNLDIEPINRSAGRPPRADA